MMSQVFEELLRRFSDISNETSGEHHTPRDFVRLLVSLVLSENKEDLEYEEKIQSILGQRLLMVNSRDCIINGLGYRIQAKLTISLWVEGKVRR